MKKVAATISAIILAGTMSISAFAVSPVQSINAPNNSDSADVKAKYVEGGKTDTIYSVDVEWGAMQFTYNAAGEGTWNPDDHTFIDIPEATWKATGNDVKVTNHSNKDVKIAFSYTSDTAYSTVIGAFDVTNKTLAAGVVDKYDEADSVTSKLTLSGTLADTATDFTKVGTVTVTVTE